MTGAETADQPRWSIGALARLTGLTVRTLYHYDELGLLRPSERRRSGHRRYTERDLHRLYQILLLRRLGMPLAEINTVLADPEDSTPLREVLARRLDELDDEVWRLTVLRRQTRDLLDQLDGSSRSDTGKLLALLGSTGIFHEYLTREQRDFLDEQADGLGADDRTWLEAQWPVVLAELAEHYRARTPVDDPKVRDSVRRLGLVAELFTGGDPQILESVDRFFREHGAGVLREVLPEQQAVELGPGLWDYVGQVYAALPAER
jgi:DNA-binding transcriptional MerR regulator